MVSRESVEKQLKRVHFNHLAWGKSEVRELPSIILPDEVILECVNGMYEGGFALLIATDVRVLLVDKKPLNYLTVEDLRFDMINEIDYSHRLFGANIRISTGSKTLKFTSVNQPRLRKLINHVQQHMSQIKRVMDNHQIDQKQHLEQINQQLQAYLIAQHEQHEVLKQQLQRQPILAGAVELPEPLKPSPQLNDFLLAQRLLQEQAPPPQSEIPQTISIERAAPPKEQPRGDAANPHLADLYAEGMQEIFGRNPVTAAAPVVTEPAAPQTEQLSHVLEINPMRIAYSKLPMALRNRKFGRPSFHAHSQATPLQTQTSPQN